MPFQAPAEQFSELRRLGDFFPTGPRNCSPLFLWSPGSPIFLAISIGYLARYGLIFSLLLRQSRLFWMNKGQIGLYIAVIVPFPIGVVFFLHGFPQVHNLTLELQNNILPTLQDQLHSIRASFKAVSPISGVEIFQVVLLTLVGSNKGTGEIARNGISKLKNCAQDSPPQPI